MIGHLFVEADQLLGHVGEIVEWAAGAVTVDGPGEVLATTPDGQAVSDGEHGLIAGVAVNHIGDASVVQRRPEPVGGVRG